MTLRLGVLHLQNHPMDETIEHFRALDRWGFDSAWVADHLVNPYHRDDQWFEAYTLLGGLARETTRVRLGALVSSITLRDPTLLAAHAIALDHLSSGRFELALGAAGAETDVALIDSPTWSAGERAERLEEQVRIVDVLMRGQSVGFDTDHYHRSGACLTPSCVQEPRAPITIGALGRRTIATAARHADAWNSYPASGRLSGGVAAGDEAVALARRRSELLDRACAAASRDPRSIRRSYLSMHGYMDAIPEPEAFAAFAAPFRAIGIEEFIVYWPRDERDVGRLENLGRALDGLRAT